MRPTELAIWACTLFALTPAASAQPADTLDWKRYYPLEAGNVWEYHDAEVRDALTRYTLVADTSANGQTYYRRQIDHVLVHYPDMALDTTRSTEFDYVRYAEGGVIAVSSVAADTVALDPCAAEGFERDLRPAFGTASPCPAPLLFPEADSARIDGSYLALWAPSAIGPTSSSDPVEVAAIKGYTVGPLFSTFVADIGPVSSGNLWGPRLHYARIGGVEYGVASALVSSEPSTRQPEEISIRVLGNPVRTQATFHVRAPLTRAARWAVTDAIGRTVQSASLDLASGLVEVDTHGLATGVYRFTLVSGEARAGVSFTVIR